MIGRTACATLGALLVAFPATGCEESETRIMCESIVECGASGSVDDCERVFGVMDLSFECLQQMKTAPCDDHLGAPQNASYFDTCWETCSPPSQQCVGDTVHLCDNGVLFVLKCGQVCRLDPNAGDYTGTCGTLGPDGSSSTDPVCWCWQRQAG